MSRNIVLIVLDTVRKDYFDEYAPRLSALADTTAHQCRAASSWSVPSHASMFTGKLPHQHEIHSESFSAEFSFASSMRGKTFLDELPAYRTGAVSSNLYMNREFEFDELFDRFEDHSLGSHWHSVPFPEARNRFDTDDRPAVKRYFETVKSCLSDERPLKSLANGFYTVIGEHIENSPIPRVVDNGCRANVRAIRDMMGADDSPAFIFANFMDAHNPLENSILYDQELLDVPYSWNSNQYDKWELLLDSVEDEYVENYRDVYGAAIDYLDRQVSDLVVDILDSTERETTVIVTADHGHNLGYEWEDGLFHHTASMSEGILHVPFEVYNPPDDWPGEVSQPVSLTALFDMVLAIADDRWDQSILDRGPVVAESIGLLGESRKPRDDSLSAEEIRYWNRMIRCGYRDNEKFEWDSLSRKTKRELRNDRPCWQGEPTEVENIPEELLNSFEVGIEEYKGRWEGVEQSLEFSESTRSSLEDLGYL